MNIIHISIPDYINEIISTLESAGFEAYIVGGCLRDSLLGMPVNDWDVCSSATPTEVISTLTNFKVIETGAAHGTVTAVRDGKISEITTFRSESNYSDHRRPDSVEFTKHIESDLCRRDFTINAMAYSTKRGLVDLFHGQEDLSNHIIRCVGNAETRFKEDALRIMRALRFSSKLGFSIESETSNAIRDCCGLLNFIAKERINHELSGILLGENVLKVLKEYKNVFKEIFEEENIFTEWEQNIKFVAESERILSLRLALLLDSKCTDDIEDILTALRFDKKTAKEVIFLLENKNFIPECNTVSLKKMLSAFGTKNSELLVYALMAKYPDDIRIHETYMLLKKVIDTSPALTVKDLKINGNDLLSLGVPQGAQIRELLSSALNAVLSDKIKNSKDDLLKFLGYKFK